MATDEDILEMLLKSRNYSFETDISNEQLLTFDYTEKVFKEKNIKFTKRDKVSLGLLNNNGKYTNLAYLLSDQSSLTVKIAEYDKNYNFKLKKEITGSLIKIFNEAEEQVNRLNDVSAIIDGSSFERKEIKSYPENALREIILNAFCHANYRINSNIKIEFFTNEIKITSPGNIFNATLNEVLNGVQTYRNPRLINVLNKIKLIENYGTGIPRTINAYKRHFVKPKFLELENFFIVKLPNLRFYKFNSEGMYLNIDKINDKINNEDDNINDKNDNINNENDKIKISNDNIIDNINDEDDNINNENDKIKISNDNINDKINNEDDNINDKNDNINNENDKINGEDDKIKIINDNTNDNINGENDNINDKIKIRNDNINDNINYEDDNINLLNNVSISHNAQKVLFEIKRNLFVTRKQIAQIINMSETTVNRAIKELKDKKYICKKETYKNGAWIILKN